MAKQENTKTSAAESVRNAKDSFKNFTTKRSTAGKVPRRYVKSKGPVGPGLRIVSSTSLPLNMQANGTLDLATVVSALEKARRGSQFYAGAQTIAATMQTQSQIDSFFAKYKGQQDGNSN
jgi:hypothetical protein